jgi:hypothetical protein
MATYTVKGTIKDQKGQPQQGIIIRATGKDFTGETALGYSLKKRPRYKSIDVKI